MTVLLQHADPQHCSVCHALSNQHSHTRWFAFACCESTMLVTCCPVMCCLRWPAAGTGLVRQEPTRQHGHHRCHPRGADHREHEGPGGPAEADGRGDAAHSGHHSISRGQALKGACMQEPAGAVVLFLLFLLWGVKGFPNDAVVAVRWRTCARCRARRLPQWCKLSQVELLVGGGPPCCCVSRSLLIVVEACLLLRFSMVAKFKHATCHDFECLFVKTEGVRAGGSRYAMAIFTSTFCHPLFLPIASRDSLRAKNRSVPPKASTWQPPRAHSTLLFCDQHATQGRPEQAGNAQAGNSRQGWRSAVAAWASPHQQRSPQPSQPAGQRPQRV